MQLLPELIGLIASFIPISEHFNFIHVSKLFLSTYHSKHPKLHVLNKLNKLYNEKCENKFDLKTIEGREGKKGRTSIEVLCFALWQRKIDTHEFYPNDKYVKLLKEWTGFDLPGYRKNPNHIKFLFIPNEIKIFIRNNVDFLVLIDPCNLKSLEDELGLRIKTEAGFCKLIEKSNSVEILAILAFIESFTFGTIWKRDANFWTLIDEETYKSDVDSDDEETLNIDLLRVICK